MGLFDNFKKAEVRSLENPNAPVSAENFLHIMGWGDFQSTAGVTVNIDNALGVPAVWAAVNFISGTLASLPLEVYRGNQRVTDGIGAWLNRAINPTTSSFQWRKYSYEQVLTGGRSVTLILRNGRGDVTDLVPLDPADLHVQEVMTSEFPTKTYRSKSRVYQASEVIDLHFMLKHNQIDIRGPVMTNKDVIGLAIAAARYGCKQGEFSIKKGDPLVHVIPFKRQELELQYDTWDHEYMSQIDVMHSTHFFDKYRRLFWHKAREKEG